MLQRGDRVQITNPNHKRAYRCGNLEDMDRGNVWVRLDDGELVCTRMIALSVAPKPSPLASFAKRVHEC